MATAAKALSAAETARAEVEAYLAAAQRKSLLRFITCGSVDDGKSTLIGRLLYDSKMLFEDQLAALESDSRKSGTQGENLDFALLVDGLGAEREQGITIDVAYRFFATDKRKFIVADTPGHEQYTRNMVTGASTADLAVILIDARKGVLTQTRRHSFLVSLLGIRHIVLAINKMDLVSFSEARYDEIVADYRAFAREAGITDFTAIPISGLNGDNITTRSAAMPWYQGPALLDHLETVPVGGRSAAPFRMPVQWVNRPNSGFRGYAGRIAGGAVRAGDRVILLPSRQTSNVESIVTFDGGLDQAVEGQSVTLTLADEVDCSRGDLIVAAPAADELAEGLVASLVWMSEDALVPGQSYWLKIGAQILSATIDRVDHVVDVDTLARGAGRPLGLNDIGRCEIGLDRAIAAIPYAENRQLGGFILIDKLTNATVAAGMVDGGRSAPSGARASADAASRIYWLAEGDAALAATMRQRLLALGRPCAVLDEASLRAGLCADLGDDQRPELIRRVREAAKLMAEAGMYVLVALVVPAAEARPGRHVDPATFEEEGADQWVI